MRGDEFPTIGLDPKTSSALPLAAIKHAEPPLHVRSLRRVGRQPPNSESAFRVQTFGAIGKT